MSTDVERLRGTLKRVGLHAIADVFEREAQKAAKTKQSYAGFLDHLLDEELARKADHSVNARIIRGRFPTVKILERGVPGGARAWPLGPRTRPARPRRRRGYLRVCIGVSMAGK